MIHNENSVGDIVNSLYNIKADKKKSENYLIAGLRTSGINLYNY